MALSIDAYYPGIMLPDSTFVYDQARELIPYNDYHPVLMAFAWRLMLHILPGPVGPLVLFNVLFWGGIALIAMAACRRHAAIAGLIICILMLLPNVIGYTGVILNDVLIAAFWCLAFGVLYARMASGSGRRAQRVLALLGLLSAMLGVLARINGWFAAIPILIEAAGGLTKKRIRTAILLWACLPVLWIGFSRVLAAEPHSPVDGIFVADLGALSHLEGRNLFPGHWTQLQSRAIAHTCYNGRGYNVYGITRCSFVVQGLFSQKLWGSHELMETWMWAVAGDPIGYVRSRVLFFLNTTIAPANRLMLASDGRTIGFPYEGNNFLSRGMLHYVRYFEATFLFIPAFWIGLGIVDLVGLALVAKGGHDAFSGVTRALILSGVVYALTYLFFGVSGDYRYYLWTVISIAIGTMMLILDLMHGMVRGRGAAGCFTRPFSSLGHKIPGKSDAGVSHMETF
ncbi:MAG: hypothetical protein KGL52_16565 [Rhodospirillales bacterium]|nr:hypothetical protein [Rhodospirillales bacterium]